jgi:hypothetical protein
MQPPRSRGSLPARESKVSRPGVGPPAPPVHWPYAAPRISQAKLAPQGTRPSQPEGLRPTAPPAPPVYWPHAGFRAAQAKLAAAAPGILRPGVVQPKLVGADAVALWFYREKEYDAKSLRADQWLTLHKECVLGCDNLEDAKALLDEKIKALTGFSRPRNATAPPHFNPVFVMDDDEEEDDGGGGGGKEKSTGGSTKSKRRGKGIDITKDVFSGPKASAWSGGPLTIASGFAIGASAAAVASVKNSALVIEKIREWKPSTGHGGFNALRYKLTATDLDEVVTWAGSTGKYFVKKGNGTGSYAGKQQLKIIHKTVDAGGGKKATFHIRVDAGELAAMALEVED